MDVIVESPKSSSLDWTSRLQHGALAVWEHVLEGGLWSFVAYFVATGLVYTFVLISVNGHVGQQLEVQMLPARTMDWLLNWHRYGFADYAGLLIYSKDGLTVYKSHSGFHLWPLYGAELVIYAFIERFSFRAAAVFNQSVIWVGAALTGWLGMRLTKHVPRHQAFLLGLGCAVVYQTFPLNLMNYWYLNPLSFSINAMLAFWLAESYARSGCWHRSVPIIMSVSVLVLALSSSMALTLFFVGAYLIAESMLEGSRLSTRRVLWYVVAPVAAVALFKAAQIAWVVLTVKNVNLTGNLNF